MNECLKCGEKDNLNHIIDDKYLCNGCIELKLLVEQGYTKKELYGAVLGNRWLKDE